MPLLTTHSPRKNEQPHCVMFKLSLLLLCLGSLPLCSCGDYHADVSVYHPYSQVLHRKALTKKPMVVYKIDRQINGYKDRHSLSNDGAGFPVVARLRTGSHVRFDRAVKRASVTGQGTVMLEGTAYTGGLTYPVSFNSGLSSESAFKNRFSRWFKLAPDNH